MNCVDPTAWMMAWTLCRSEASWTGPAPNRSWLTQGDTRLLSSFVHFAAMTHTINPQKLFRMIHGV